MTINIRVKPGSSQSRVESTADPAFYTIYTHSHPHDNAANDEIIKLLSDYFTTAKTNIAIRRGQRSKLKTIDII